MTTSSPTDLDKAIKYYSSVIDNYTHHWQRDLMEQLLLAAKRTQELEKERDELKVIFIKEHWHTCLQHTDEERAQAHCPVCNSQQLSQLRDEVVELTKQHAIWGDNIIQLRADLAQEKIWKEEDPRMLREQIRVDDEAFQRLHEEHEKLKSAITKAAALA